MEKFRLEETSRGHQDQPSPHCRITFKEQAAQGFVHLSFENLQGDGDSTQKKNNLGYFFLIYSQNFLCCNLKLLPCVPSLCTSAESLAQCSP